MVVEPTDFLGDERTEEGKDRQTDTQTDRSKPNTLFPFGEMCNNVQGELMGLSREDVGSVQGG